MEMPSKKKNTLHKKLSLFAEKFKRLSVWETISAVVIWFLLGHNFLYADAVQFIYSVGMVLFSIAVILIVFMIIGPLVLEGLVGIFSQFVLYTLLFSSAVYLLFFGACASYECWDTYMKLLVLVPSANAFILLSECVLNWDNKEEY